MSTRDQFETPANHPARAVAEFLEHEQIEFELVEHEPTLSATAEAHATHHPPDQVAKTVVLHDGEAYVLAAIPASERLDLHKLRERLDATRRLQLASEEEIGREFPSFEVGALPPFGPIGKAVEVIDRSLLESPRILCPAGDHRHSVLLDPSDLVRISAAKVADICED